MAKKIEILENTLLKLLVRRGTDTDRRNISLSEGELGYTTDTERLFIGNGQPGGVVAGNRYLGSDSDPAVTFTTALTGDLVFDTNTKSLCAFKGSGVWERVSSLTESTGDIDVLVDAGDILSNACGRNLSINTNGRIQTNKEVVFNKIDTAGWAYLNIPRKVRFYDGSSSEAFTFPTNALGGKYLRTDASGVLTWEDPVGAAEFFYNSENGPIPVGAVLPFTAGGVIPTGYIVCNGQEVSQTTYSDLFDVIGTNYGTTNPGSTFKVPDYSLSTLYGVDSDPHNAQVYKVGADVNIGGVQLHKTFFAIGSVEDSGATSQAATTSVIPSTLVSSTANAAACWDSYNNTISTDWSSVFTGYNAFNQGNTPSRTELRIHNPIVAEGGTDGSDQSFYDYKVQIDWESNTVIGTALNNGGNSSSGNKMRVLNEPLLSGDNEYAFLRIPTTATNGSSTSPVIRINKELRKITAFPYSEITTKVRDPNIAVEITEYEVGISSGTTITQEGFGSYSSGWVNSGDNSVAVANSATLSFNHNLNSDNVVVQVYAATNAAGDNATLISGGVEAHSGNGWYNSVVTDVTTTTLDVFLGDNGWRDTQQTGAAYPWAGAYIKVVALAADAVVSTPSTQSPLSAQGTIYVIKAIPDTVANPTLTVVSPLTATVDGVNKTNTAFSPLVGDIVIGQPDAAEAVPPGVEAFDTAGTSTFTTKTRYTKFHVTGSGSGAPSHSGASAGTCIGYLDLPVGTVLDLTIGAGVGNTTTTGNYTQIAYNGTVLVKSDGADHPATTANTANWSAPPNTGTLNTTYTVGGNQVVDQNSFIIPGTSQGVDGNGGDEESIGSASFWGSYPAPGSAMHASGVDIGNPPTTADGIVMFEWADTVSGGTTEVTGGGSSLLKYGEIDAGNIGVVTSNPPTVGDFTTTVVSNSIAGDTHDTTFECTFNTSLANDNYNVMFEIISNGPDINKDNNLKTPVVFNKTASGFRFNVEEGAVSNVGDNQINVRIESNEVGLGSIGGLKDPNHGGGTFDVTTSFQDLDLSSIVGSNKAQVTMEVYDGDTGCNLFFRRKGSVTDPYNAGNNAGWGASSVTTGPSNDGGIVTVVTDSSGVTEYRSDGTSNGVNYKVLTYQVIS